MHVDRPAGPLDAPADVVPAVGGAGDLTLVDGRTFAISDRAGDMRSLTHGLVRDDRRHVSRLDLAVRGAVTQTIASTSPAPLSAVTVTRLLDADGAPSSCLVVRRRWLAGGMRDDIELRETGPAERAVDLTMTVAADFAHVFDVKAGRAGAPAALFRDGEGWTLMPDGTPDGEDAVWSTRVRCEPPPDAVDDETSTFTWHITIPPRSSVPVCVAFEPVVADDPVDMSLLLGAGPTAPVPVPVFAVTGWRSRVPTVVSTDHRLAPAFDQALADLAALRIIDRGHPERVLTAAGAPWYMTLFGRDSLLTASMTLGFDDDLAAGVLLSLADLQGRSYDERSEEQPGRILHELRRHGSGGPFAERSRYYGTVDATALFVMLARDARRWGALDDATLQELTPAIGAAVGWLGGDGDRNADGWVDYQRTGPEGLSNQGWKDSWNGVSSAAGVIPKPPIALVEVQGYTYAALLAAAELADEVDLGIDRDRLRSTASSMRDRFNEVFWDERGWFVIALDGAGQPVDSLTTNPGHALWCGIADPALADRYLDRLLEPEMATGWGLRTLASSMSAYDPLSYHNGSVWPHDTAICVAGAARYGRWDVVDALVDGLLDVATHFGGRPPELFAGLGRDDVPAPVAYPAACSPQAWASASVLLLIRSLLGIDVVGDDVVIARTVWDGVSDLTVHGLHSPRGRVAVSVERGVASVAAL